MCGLEYGLLTTLPEKWSGVCTRAEKPRSKRASEKYPAVYIDSIGQPRGIPYEFKARDEVKSGFESIFIWI